MRHWRHRPDHEATVILGETIVHETCRTCQLTRTTWLHRGQPWKRSPWMTEDAADRWLREVASEAVLPT